MRIFDFDEEIFTERLLQESKFLLDQIKEVDKQILELDSPDHPLNQEIIESHERLQRAKLITLSAGGLVSATQEYQGICAKKITLKNHFSYQRECLFNSVAQINNPVIQYLWNVATEGLNRLRNQFVYRRIDKQKDALTDVVTVKVSTNQTSISEAREALTSFQSKIRSLPHAFLGDIQKEAGKVAEKVNNQKHNLTVIEERPSRAEELEMAMRGNPPNIPLAVYKQAQKGTLYEKFDDLEGSFKINKAWFLDEILRRLKKK